MMYLTLAGAIVAEILGTTAMKYSDGFTRLWPTLTTAACYLVAFTLLAQTLRTMEVGIAYAIWAGVGTALIAVIGVAVFQESVTALKIAGLLLVIAGTTALNLGGSH
ncbi:DMT family transporter [Streptomyces aidingensis]|uniref:Small multidrug resistance pump n=1 Tax=Streptomyces aidingensis TaxID=910347 RepID=A0A1I1M572_9ACTN|nr:multidrug efflux SMR transporter [Streptomyces aidingensis]SFC80514.1 small multidrug resistance pump [Streptomyces aidingensis]